MAILKTGCGCVLQAGFRLAGLTLAANDRVRFRTKAAIENGEGLPISVVLAADGTGNSEGDHVTLSYDLSGTGVLPGCYTWELSLLAADGTERLLLPADENTLFIARREET